MHTPVKKFVSILATFVISVALILAPGIVFAEQDEVLVTEVVEEEERDLVSYAPYPQPSTICYQVYYYDELTGNLTGTQSIPHKFSGGKCTNFLYWPYPWSYWTCPR